VARASSNKRAIDQAKKERAALKRERRRHFEGERAPEGARGTRVPPIPEREVLDALALLHERFDAGELGFEELEARRADLVNLLTD
jgi:hypothetical protein